MITPAVEHRYLPWGIFFGRIQAHKGIFAIVLRINTHRSMYITLDFHNHMQNISKKLFISAILLDKTRFICYHIKCIIIVTVRIIIKISDL